MKIWVDADACPVKDEIERIAFKRGLGVVHVCALALLKRERPGVEIIYVPSGPDAVDEWIIDNCSAGDIVITQDVPLAHSVVGRGCVAIDVRGRELDDRNSADRLQMRDLLTALRDRGEQTRGPAAFSAKDRRNFAATFGRILDRLHRPGKPADEVTSHE